ncbi:helix-turn-helix transcriptional regulator [Magnetovibrio sp.]|uniref:helix-turn-helix domain-containing protein n=1 Tax=Magnetovibrio sp. TaxID=2024836 RepID=UPI002F945401
MTSAADSAATVAPQAECEVAQAKREGNGERSGASGHLPVFDAFDGLGLTGRDVAELVGVTPPTVSKWRSAKVHIPGEKLAFLTLVLAHLLDEADKVANNGGECSSSTRGPIEAAHAALVYQDVLNRDLDPSDVRVGAQRFRAWWSSGEALKLQDKRFQPSSNADILDVLKKMRTKR